MKNNHWPTLISIITASILFTFSTGCNKAELHKEQPHSTIEGNITQPENQIITQKTMVLNIHNLHGGSVEVVLSESARIFSTSDPGMITKLQKALQKKLPVQVSFDPWNPLLKEVTLLKPEAYRIDPQLLVRNQGLNIDIDLASVNMEELNSPAYLNTQDRNPTLVNVIPDLATAQLIFNYLVQQCCVFPGPIQIDYCIPFQYAQDGCHARAHKMCYVINTKFNYDTHKIFSIANDHVGEWLCVQAQKWGGCCLKWWFHVAPLVNVQTPGGVKAFVIDPSMFDQPVLLSTWLHAQENPLCSGGSTPNVTTISVQPTASYRPNDFYNQTYVLDPYYSYTNNTLNNYHSLITCP